MADTLPSSPLRLRGRPLTERIVSKSCFNWKLMALSNDLRAQDWCFSWAKNA